MHSFVPIEADHRPREGNRLRLEDDCTTSADWCGLGRWGTAGRPCGELRFCWTMGVTGDRRMFVHDHSLRICFVYSSSPLTDVLY